MSEEEQEAVEQLKKLLNDFDNEDISETDLWIINNLIEKQQKEIEEQKQNWKELLHEYGLKCEELNNSISKDKIRKLIENNEEDIDYSVHDIIDDLRKLLEG